MRELILGFWVSRAVHAAAYFGLADFLRDGPKTVDELAAASKTHAPSLKRLLRALSSIDIFAEQEDGRYRLTPLAATLDSEVPGSMRSFAMAELGQEHFEAWRDFPYSVATGEMAFEHGFKQNPWQYYAENPEHAAVFNASMTMLTQVIEISVITTYDFTPFNTIADIGGGQGEFLSTILQANTHARGILFDAPQVISGAKRLEQSGLASRSEMVGGDFFQAVPAGADAYLLKWIIHDWADAESIQILGNIRQAMNPEGRVLIVETVIPDTNEPFVGKWLDLNMMVMTGGKERTASEYRALLERAGLELVRIVLTPSGFSVVEARRP